MTTGDSLLSTERNGSTKGRCVFTKVVKRFLEIISQCDSVRGNLYCGSGMFRRLYRGCGQHEQCDRTDRCQYWSIEAYLEKNQNATELLTEEFKEDYSAKTRTIAMLLSQDGSFITDDRTLEELRVTVNADMISISDHEAM